MVKTSGYNSPRTNLRILDKEPTIGLQANQDNKHYYMKETCLRHGLVPLMEKFFIHVVDVLRTLMSQNYFPRNFREQLCNTELFLDKNSENES